MMVVILLITILTILILVALWCACEIAKRCDEEIELERHLRNRKGK